MLLSIKGINPSVNAFFNTFDSAAEGFAEDSDSVKIRGAGLNLSDGSLIYNHIPISSESG